MPLRTCVGCRSVREKSRLIRFVVSGGHIKPDRSGSLEGRGAYLCPRKDCIEAALRNHKAFSRTFKRDVELPDLEEFLEAIEDLVVKGSE